MNNRKMEKALQRTKKQLIEKGFKEWGVVGYPDWIYRLDDKRQWRRITKRVWGVSVKA